MAGDLPRHGRARRGARRDAWYRDPERLATHRERVRVSLETFVNGALGGLDEMLRTGWFIIRRARATITKLVEVPDGAKVGE